MLLIAVHYYSHARALVFWLYLKRWMNCFGDWLYGKNIRCKTDVPLAWLDSSIS